MPRRRSVVSQFGKRVRALRKAAGLTQPELAERADLAVETVSRLETGSWPNTTVEVAERLAEALGAPITALFQSDPQPAGTALTPEKKRALAIIGDLPEDDVADVLRALQLLIGVRSRRRSRARTPRRRPT